MVLKGPQLLATLAALFLLSHHVQASRLTRELAVEIVDLTTPQEENVTEAPRKSVNYDDLTDFGAVIKKNENASYADNWREGLKFSEALGHMRNTSKLTDCLFIVGPDGQEEEFEAHAVILAAVSPVFEAAFRNSTNFRMKDWQPAEFRKLLRFIYSGDLCFEDFEEACTLLKHSTSLALAGAKDAARMFISVYMHPNRLWQAFQCARQAGDLTLLESVSKFISEKTSDALKDPKFDEISQEDLANLLEREDLNINSEVDIFEAATRWGLVQVRNQGLKPTAELIRKVLGPRVIKNIRFLTMTGAEFSRMHKMLDYEESLAVLLNINNPGILEMPKNLSSSTTKREGKKGEAAVTFKSKQVKDQKCGTKDKGLVEISGFDTITEIPNTGRAWNLAGIQIPKSLEAQKNCSSVRERFDVIILDPENNPIYKYEYDDVPPCTTKRYVLPGNSVSDEKLISVLFNPRFTVAAPISSERYKIKIRFHGEREYPTFVDAGSSNSDSKYLESGQTFFMASYGFIRTLKNSSFVYSIVVV